LAVKEEFNDAVIIRPSNIYGESDRFLYYYTNDLRRGLNNIPLWKKGEWTIKMPVHVDKLHYLSLNNIILINLFLKQSDVADGVMKILHNKDIKGVTYDFVG
jgi:hypothetical protein